MVQHNFGSQRARTGRQTHRSKLHVNAHKVGLDALILRDEAVELRLLEVVGLRESDDAVYKGRRLSAVCLGAE